MGKVLKSQLYKLDPRMRMIANGDQEVNALRAEQAPDVAVRARKLVNLPVMRGLEAQAVTRTELAEFERATLKEAPDEVYVNVLVQLKEDTDKLPEALRRRTYIQKRVRRGSLVTTEVALGEMQGLLEDPDIVAVERAEQIRFSPPVKVSHSASGPGDVRSVANAPAHHRKVVVGIIDVEGFDFAHPDFLDEDGQTRFLRIWDQGGGPRPSPQKFGYGSEITHKHMNRALRAQDNPRFGMSPTELEPQSQMVPGSHGTHVASIAAGNHGACPQAYLAGVLISIPEEDRGRRKSFYDSTRILHAIEYLIDLAEELSDERGESIPISINISLGTNGHAHDASSATSRWLDYALATAGRSICVAAGNAGQEAPTHPTDWGFVMGRIHTSGRLENVGDSADIEWIVLGDMMLDLSENELEIWYSPRDRFAVQLKPPGSDWLPVLEPGQFIENQEMPDGTFLSVYNELYNQANGSNYIACYLSPLFSTEGIVGVRAGTWLVRLIARDARDGQYHGWIERDDPRRLGDLGQQQAWLFPSFFSRESNVDNSSVSSLACGRDVISVANLDEETGYIHKTSSQGPTRDGRHKPEVSAPGTGIVAAKGFDPGDHWVAMTGTSMASPYVTGVAGLMLAANPQLTAAQVQGIIRRTAKPLGADVQWQDDAGYGRIDPEGCLEEVARLSAREDRTP